MHSLGTKKVREDEKEAPGGGILGSMGLVVKIPGDWAAGTSDRALACCCCSWAPEGLNQAAKHAHLRYREVSACPQNRLAWDRASCSGAEVGRLARRQQQQDGTLAWPLKKVGHLVV